MLDKDGYPTEKGLAELSEICNKTPLNKKKILEVIKDNWYSPDWGFATTQRTLYLSTGGWSGNEQTIGKIESSIFGLFCFKELHRGGHYVFDLTRIRNKRKTVVNII